MSILLSCHIPSEITGELTLSAASEHVALAGTTVIATFAAADPDATASVYTATIDWGDGTRSLGTIVGANGTFAVEAGHSYADEGRYALRATITHQCSASLTPSPGGAHPLGRASRGDLPDRWSLFFGFDRIKRGEGIALLATAGFTPPLFFMKE